MLLPNWPLVNASLKKCRGKVEMSPCWQSRNVAFSPGVLRIHVSLSLPVKRRRAMLASNPIKE
jgi:hypothetical protein